MSACGGRAVVENSPGAGGAFASTVVGGQPGTAGRGAGPSLGGSPTTGVAGSPNPTLDAGSVPAVDGGGVLPPVSEKCLATNPMPLCPPTAADVACRLDTDCITRVAPASCGATCLQMAYGLNKASTASCDLCPPDPDCNGQFVYLVQDCRIFSAGQGSFSARCVDGQCRSFAEPPGLPQ